MEFFHKKVFLSKGLCVRRACDGFKKLKILTKYGMSINFRRKGLTFG